MSVNFQVLAIMDAVLIMKAVIVAYVQQVTNSKEIYVKVSSVYYVKYTYNYNNYYDKFKYINVYNLYVNYDKNYKKVTFYAVIKYYFCVYMYAIMKCIHMP